MQKQELTGIHIEGHIHIFDPETKQTYVNNRVENYLKKEEDKSAKHIPDSESL